jgi:hypothetical protein
MKNWSYFLVVALVYIFSCTSPQKNKQVSNPVNTDTLDKQRFFPVTNYFKGQLFEMQQAGLNPIMYTMTGDKKDSVWVKIEGIDSIFAPFLSPVIDSVNLIQLFVERKFLDQSIDAITLTYDPVKKLPDSLDLSNWTVYIDPKSGNVKKVFMIKNKADKTLQLTWNNNTNCKMVYLTAADGKFTVDKEVLISWDY